MKNIIRTLAVAASLFVAGNLFAQEPVAANNNGKEKGKAACCADKSACASKTAKAKKNKKSKDACCSTADASANGAKACCASKDAKAKK